MMKKIKEQRVELARLNASLQDATNKLNIIYSADLVKYKLSELDSDNSFRQIISNPDFKNEVEAIFKTRQSRCITLYDELINKRNSITHRYSNRYWKPDTAKLNKKKTIQEFASRCKMHVLLKQ